MRPPARGSNVTVSSGSAETEWPCGHHSVVRLAHTSKACSGGQSTVKTISSGSIYAAFRVRARVLGREAEAARRVAPDLLEVGAHGRDALVVQPVEPPRALRAVGDEAGVLEQAQVPRHGGAADRQRVRELLDGAVAAREQLDDRPAVRVAEGVERVAGDRSEGHAPKR